MDYKHQLINEEEDKEDYLCLGELVWQKQIPYLLCGSLLVSGVKSRTCKE